LTSYKIPTSDLST